MQITKATEISTELFERINTVRAQESPTEYMVGVKLTDRNCCFHTVKALDCDIATGALIGLVEYGNKIAVEIVPREMVLYRV